MKTIDKNKIIEILEDMSDDDLFSIWNEYANENGYNNIYNMEEFDEICDSMTASDIARRCFYGKFNPNDNYFIFNGYANFESSDYLEDFIDFDDLADYCIRNDEDFNDQEIRDILDADDTTEDTED